MVAYGDNELKFKMNLADLNIKVSNDYRDDCIIRSGNLKRVKMTNVKVDNYNGNSIIKNYGKNDGEIVIEKSDFGKEDVKLVIETDEKFVVDSI